MNKQLAQINIARRKASLEDSMMKEFVDFLGPVNQLAEESPGFIWRLVTEPTAASPWDDMVIINMSVWKDIESLKHFTYKTVHSYFVKSRKKWFHHLDKPHYVMWWIEEGHIPTLEEAAEKLAFLDEHGASPAAFNFVNTFLPVDE